MARARDDSTLRDHDRSVTTTIADSKLSCFTEIGLILPESPLQV